MDELQKGLIQGGMIRDEWNRTTVPPSQTTREDEQDEVVLAEGYVLPLGSELQAPMSLSAEVQNNVQVTQETVDIVDCFGVQVMRRRSDGRVNANDILKAAGGLPAEQPHSGRAT
ncbi:hypothetical protein BJ741DRAFT_580865 [Chytriomyces cf. hyalinus JEL632]|nr:hypothetical protein BJ741DRAFT_580865 [Chytriomyces cf. hyalinus JEL632]